MSGDEHRRALAAGWRRSLQASSERSPVPWHARVWARYKWWIVSALLFLIGEVVLFALGSGAAGHF